jgi:hypothetical protein
MKANVSDHAGGLRGTGPVDYGFNQAGPAFRPDHGVLERLEYA